MIQIGRLLKLTSLMRNSILIMINILIDDEIVNWMASDNIEESEEEANHIISECDTDGDEKLSVEEIINNKDLWLESDVTDYGQMLNHEEL